MKYNTKIYNSKIEYITAEGVQQKDINACQLHRTQAICGPFY